MGTCTSSRAQTPATSSEIDLKEWEQISESERPSEEEPNNVPHPLRNESVDEGLYSRQLYVLGNAAQKRLGASRFLVSGLDGCGAEICKNLVLSGVGSLALHDNKRSSGRDLSSNFFIGLNDVELGLTRAEAVSKSLAPINDQVQLSICADLNLESIESHDVIVISGEVSERNRKMFAQIARRCRGDKKLIFTECVGAVGFVFCDFGEQFAVVDGNGEPPVEVDLMSISRDEEAIAITVNDRKHGLEDGDEVIFEDVQGMEEINGETRRIIALSPIAFALGDTSGFSEDGRGGRAIQVKREDITSHDDFSRSCRQPRFIDVDWSRPQRSEELHVMMQTLSRIREDYNGGEFSFGDFFSYCEHYHETEYEGDLETLDEALCARFFHAAKSPAGVGPMCAFFGGLVAQEAIKAATGKFTPVGQWLYYDELDQCHGSSDGIFEGAIQKEISNLRAFVVGCGAIGCELLKNLALMGVGSGEEGALIVTDHDEIERSNLSRQFLFRPKDIGSNKAVTAAEAVRRGIAGANIIVHQEK